MKTARRNTEVPNKAEDNLLLFAITQWLRVTPIIYPVQVKVVPNNLGLQK